MITFSNTLETVMFNQYLEANNIFVPQQLGFRKGITVLKAVFNLRIFLMH
jgi:hypothetical protein